MIGGVDLFTVLFDESEVDLGSAGSFAFRKGPPPPEPVELALAVTSAWRASFRRSFALSWKCQEFCVQNE